ncbi:MAG: T9SS type A sorting domain-containing protein [Chitinophagaceae bacterium]|nr:MAG: T9SS type A sorting domain-containing protein [Chitinophagaceae bacterium]
MTTFLHLSLRVAVVVPMLILFVQQSIAQTFTRKSVSMGSNTNGFYEYLPQNYNVSGQTFPVIIFLHGQGDLGNGTSDLPTLLNHALPRFINEGRFPSTFTVNGASHQFIVMIPQFVNWPSPADVNGVIEYVKRTYKANANRIYITGSSMGGGGTWETAASSGGYISKIAAIVPVCGASGYDQSKGNRIADARLPVWATHNSNDPKVSVNNTHNYISGILNRNASAPVKKTIFNAADHDAWTLTYDPNFREDGKNIYEWMLGYAKNSGGTSTNRPPVVSGGGNKTLTLPSNSVVLDGSGSYDPENGSLTYTWTKTGGPTQYSLSNGTTSRATISNLVAGTYVFRLSVSDAQGASSSSFVQVTINSGGTLAANAGADVNVYLPENYHILKGSATGSTNLTYQWTKVSGGQVNIVTPTSSRTNIIWMREGTYVFELTASDNAGRVAKDQITVRILPANINVTATDEVQMAPDELIAESTITAGSKIFPNPVDQQFQLTLDNEYSGTVQVVILDQSGRAFQKTEVQKTAGTITKTISLASGMQPGIYLVRLQSGNEVKTLKMLKK